METLRFVSLHMANACLGMALALTVLDLIARRLGAHYERLDSCLGKFVTVLMLLLSLGLFLFANQIV